jgi:hypothetical protein
VLTDVWTGIGSRLSERWAAALFSPAILFWATGLVAVLFAYGAPSTWAGVLGGWFTALGGAAVPVQIAWVAGVLGGLLVGQFVVAQLTLPVLRLLEGYWPGWLEGLRQWMVGRVSHRRDGQAALWRTLQTAEAGRLPSAQRATLARLERQLARVPVQVEQRMPTRLGNTLRASEARPGQKYGLDAIVCWPRLWLVLPASVQAEVSAARTRLDQAIQLWIWGALVVVWTIWLWWAPLLAALMLTTAWGLALDAARAYGDLVEASYDLYRADLYRAVRAPLPSDAAEEYACGLTLTRYLRRGSRSSNFRLLD